TRSESATRHVLGITHQLIEVDLGGGYESTGAASTFDDAFTLKTGEGVARGHQAHFVHAGELTLGCNWVAREQFGRLNPLTDSVLDAFVDGSAVAVRSLHRWSFWLFRGVCASHDKRSAVSRSQSLCAI